MGATTSISGLVTSSNGQPVLGVIIKAVWSEERKNYQTVTKGDGRYHIHHMHPGGPYTVTANFSGFQAQPANNVILKHGENDVLNFELEPV
ncbi:MAG: hypothetical protein Tsb002_19640 [Wenzhouxiangellaceae bacterium]